MKKCPNGHFVGDNVKFCPKCGAPIGQPPMIPLPKTNANHGNLSKKTIAIFVVAGIAVLSVLFAILGGAAWYFYGYQQDKYSLEGLAKASVNYDYIDNFHEGLARVVKGSKYGFIDKMGNEVIPCDFDVIEEEDVDYDFHDGFALVHKGEKAYYINKEGQKAFQLNNYDNLSAFSNGYAAVYKNGKLGYIDTKGNEVIACSLNGYGYGFSEGLAAVMKGDKVGYIDTKGNVVVPFQYEIIDLGEPGQFAEGLAAVCKNERFGYIDKSGNEVVPCKYSIAFDFRDGRALVRKDDKYGYIDKSGKEVIPCSFDEAEFFSEGFAAVSKDGKYYVIDKNGKEVFSLSAYDTGFGSPIFEEGLAPVFRKIGDSHVCGFVDTSGKEVIPCVYTNWPSFSEGLAVVEKDGVYGFVDKKGNSTFDLQDEGVKSVIQAKIDEKEKARIEEERRAEEERKRIEEENQPHNRFFKIAKQGGSAWVIRSSGQMAFFYPKDKSYGKVSFLILNGNDVLMSSGSTTYTISNNHISFNYQTDVWGKTFYMSFTGEIKNDGEKVKIVGQYSGSTVNGPIEVTLDQVRPLISDPFKK